ncbi:MAG: N-acetyl-gamma-glutamyl-phosphate reductase, partial [Acidobacteria bacterium]
AHGESQQVAEGVLAADPPLVIDLAADFRVHDRALYERFYGEHGAWPLVESFTYGLADVHGGRLAGARRIAAPGCFATATLLALHPLAAAGLLAEPPVAVALTGSTGSGTTPRRTTHHPLRAHNLFAYAAAGHRHEAEIVEQLRVAAGRDALGAVLLTHSAPLVRGIHVTATVTPARACPDPLALLREAWAGRPFVRVLDAPPELAAVVGTNFAHVHAVARDGGARVVVFAAIDNLVKGAAGQAVQAMNLALGLDEAAGLGFAGIYPC